jgi:hypothetical protein
MVIYEYALQGTIIGYDGQAKQIVTIYNFDLPGYAQTQLSFSGIDHNAALGLIYQLMATESAFAVWQSSDTDANFCYGLGQYSAKRFMDVLNTDLAGHVDYIKRQNVFGTLGKWLDVFGPDRNLWEFWKFGGLRALILAADELYGKDYATNFLPGLGAKFGDKFKEITSKNENASKFNASQSIKNFLNDVKSTSLAPNQIAYLFYLTVALEAAVMVYEKVKLIKTILSEFKNNNYITDLQKDTGNNLIPLLVILSVGFNHVLPDYESDWRKYLSKPDNMADNWAKIKTNILAGEANLKYVAAVIGAELFNYVFKTYRTDETAKKNFERWLGEENTNNRQYFLTLLNTINDSNIDLSMLLMFNPLQKRGSDDLKKAIEILGASFSYMYRALDDKLAFPFYADIETDKNKRYIVLKDKNGKKIFSVDLSTTAISFSADVKPATITSEADDTTASITIQKQVLEKVGKIDPELRALMEQLLKTISQPFEVPQEKVGLAYKSLITDSGSQQKPVTVAEMHRGKIYTNNFNSDG